MRFQIADFRWQIGIAVAALASSTLIAQSRPQPGVRLPLAQLDAQMFHVSAGKRLKPKAWPNGARVAVGLSFDVDNATASLATGDLVSETISRGEYGAVDGLPRIIRLLDKHQIPASFFIPAVSHLLHPQMIPEILKSGRHEIGVHGWIHEHLPSVNDAAYEQEMLTRAIETLTKAIGKKPVGYRAPSWQFSPWTMKQVKDAGFLYESSLMASDDAYEILLDKQPTGVVELPIERILDDFPYFGGATNGGLPNPDLIEQVFRSEFDVAYEEGGLYILTMHPHITGHRSRVAGLEKLVVHMKSKPGVWFATHEQIARYVKANAGGSQRAGASRYNWALMPVLELLTSSGLGSLLGMRHALESDHLAAVSTLVTGERSTYKAAFLGACWGLGHTLALVAVGVVLVVLRAEMPVRVTDLFEFFVALMLVGLGVRAIFQAARQGEAGPVHAHQHGSRVHAHHTGAAHIHIGAWTLARRPLLVGAIHGLAGSGALTALVLATLPSTAAQLTYMGLFGLGSTLGMAALSGILGWPLARLGSHRTLARAVSLSVGCASTILGVTWGYPLLARLL